ncbi:hypothetical protein CspeluHIS016_0104350 [Cutaneotrichosporon spelunceum]|uniref:Uncharacterized protein n=1 Tax=Cutaneotrichosporon spelunceum TaxID=1672016 RepID=A0AAD3TNP2_9TREE|nr:hypothetical protein CspeluHIS016_0104350 [Cutaneotrichosporon spelunceum]
MAKPPAGASGAPYAYELAYSHALSVTKDEPFGPLKPDPKILELKVPPRPDNYASLDRYKKREVDLSRAWMSKTIKAQQNAEIERAKKAAAFKKISDREKAKQKRVADKEAARKRKEADKEAARKRKEAEMEAVRKRKEAEMEAARKRKAADREAARKRKEEAANMSCFRKKKTKAPATTGSGATPPAPTPPAPSAPETKTKADTPPKFWHPSPPMCAYRRPLASGDGWPLMSRTMTQAIQDIEHEGRLIRTANGQFVGFL